jgi:N-carbamoyl-L-amino-acid hydrolase
MDVETGRLRADIESNAEFGALEDVDGRGRTVLTGSEADRRARDYFVDRLEAAGFDVRVDPVGNVAGRWVAPSADPDAAPVAMGSHLDSVPQGGIFDGPLGVYGALEAARAIQESAHEPTRPIDVVAFTEEEGGRFDVGLLGSSVASGDLDLDQALSLTDETGTSLADYLEGIGYRGTDDLRMDEWDAWFEIHIEQGLQLESAGVSAGVVTAINGITNCDVRIDGHADHGSTPMAHRTDAMAAASEFALDVEDAAADLAERETDTAVGTVGKLSVQPNARNVVPGTVEITTDFRSVEHDVMDAIVDAAEASLDRLEDERGVETAIDRYRDQAPTPMSERCRSALLAGADRAGIDAMDIHSGGGHDTIKIADHADVGLLFAPSRDGISHNPDEWTDWADCGTVTRVLAEAAGSLAAA